MARAEGVARVLPLGDGGDFESPRKFGGKIFERVYSQVDSPGRQRLFDLLGEHALGADFGEGNVGDLVAGGVDDLDLDLVGARSAASGEVVGVREGKLGAAGADAKVGGIVVRSH